MLKLFLVRHGQTFWKVEKRIQGQAESDLTDEGIRQAQLLGMRLRGEVFDHIYVSPLRRTMQTLNAMAVSSSVPVTQDERLMEICMGDWQGKLVEDLKRDYPEEIDSFWHTPHKFYRESCETYQEVYNRGVSFVRSLMSKHKSGVVLVITHGAFLKILYTYFRYMQLYDVPLVDHPFSTALSVVEWNGGLWNMLSWNDTIHLEAQF